MKAKLDFKSKRTIIITAIIAALAIGAGVGAYFYAKGNNEASATTNTSDSSQTATDEAPSGDKNKENPASNDNNGNENGETNTPTDGTGDNTGDNGATNNGADANGDAGNGGAANNGANGNGGAGNGGVAGGNGAGADNGAGAGAGAGAGDADDGDATTTTETVVEENPWESHATTWTPEGLSRIGADNKSAADVDVLRAIINGEKTNNVTTLDENGNKVVKPGEEFTYTITLKNSGDIDGKTTVEDTLPKEVILVSATPEAEVDGSKLIWKDIEVKLNEDTKIEVKVKVGEKATGTIKNVAKVVKEDKTDDVPDDKTPTIDEVVDISATKVNNVEKVNEDGKKTVKPGETFTYTIKLTNTGNVAGTTTVTDTISDKLIVVKTEPEAEANGNELTWKDVEVKADKDTVITVTVKVKDLATGEIENIANIGEDKKAEDPDKPTIEEIPNIEITKSSSGANKILKELDTITYTIIATNIGNGKGTITLSDEIPEGTSLVEGSISDNGNLGEDGKTITWTDVEVGAAKETEDGVVNGTASRTFTVRINPFTGVETKKIVNDKVKKDGEDEPDAKTEDDVKKEYLSFNVTKGWEDADNNEGLQDEVTFTLYKKLQDGSLEEIKDATGAPVTATAKSKDWKADFGDKLDKYDDNGVITYVAKETSFKNSDKYNTIYEGEKDYAENGEKVTNELKFEEYNDESITIHKVWVDNNKEDNTRENGAEFKLFKKVGDGDLTEVESKEPVTLLENDDVVFRALPKYENKQVITYFVKETTVPTNYTATYKEKDNTDATAETGVKDGGTITNTINWTSVKRTLIVKKAWQNPEGLDLSKIEVPEITFNVAGGKETVSKVAENDKAEFELEKYNAKGEVITYTVTESVRYEGEIKYYKDNTEKPTIQLGEGTNEVTITNRFDVTKLNDKDISVTKVWDDANNNEGLRTKVTFDAYNGQNKAKSATTSTINSPETVKIEGLQRYADDGRTFTEINYTIKEATVLKKYNTVYPEGKEGYAEDGDTITNILKYDDYNEALEIEIEKKWIDNDEEDHTRKNGAIFTLYKKVGEGDLEAVKDGETEKTKTLTADGKVKFGKLPKYENKQVVEYFIKETARPDFYITTYKDADGNDTTSEFVSDGAVITNRLDETQYKEKSFKITKVWNDADNHENQRDIVTFDVYNGTEKVDGVTKSTTGIENREEVEFTGLQKYTYNENTQKYTEIKYTVKEQEFKPEIYTTIYEDNKNYAEEGGIVTNELKFENYKDPFSVNKSWVDNENADSTRGTGATFTLYKKVGDGKETRVDAKSTTINEPVLFGELPRYENGKFVTYYVKETSKPDNYTATYKEADGTEVTAENGVKNGGTITNTLSYETVERTLTVKKSWQEPANLGTSYRPTVTFEVYNGEEKVASKKADENGEAVFNNLPKYTDKNELITYTIKETVKYKDNVKYYIDFDENNAPTVQLTETNNEVTITNRFDVTQLKDKDISVTKAWNDADNNEGLRTIVTFDVYNGETKVDGASNSTKTTDDTEKVEFKGLQRYADDGTNFTEINYTIKEATVLEKYTTEYPQGKDGYAEDKDTVTNKLKFDDYKEAASIKVTKTWVDNNENDNTRGNGATFALYKKVGNGELTAVTGKTATLTDNGEIKFDKLPKYENEEAITYYIKETSTPDNYKVTYKEKDGTDVTATKAVKDKGTITNTIDWTSVKNQLIVKKAWQNPEGLDLSKIEVPEITFNVAGGEETVSKVAKNDKAEFELEKYNAKGEVITYTVTETVKYEGDIKYYKDNKEKPTIQLVNETNEVTITNRFDVTKLKDKDISVTKVWDDAGNHEKLRTTVTFDAYNGENKAKSASTKTTDSPETVQIKGLQRYADDGTNFTEISYIIKEADFTNSDKYTTEYPREREVNGEKEGYAEDGDTIKNILKYETFNDTVPVKKIWKDNKNEDGNRPDSVKFRITGGTNSKDVTLTGGATAESWTDNKIKLPTYDEEHQVIEYTVKELDGNNVLAEGAKLKGKNGMKYTVSYGSDGLTVTNKAATKYTVKYYTNGHYTGTENDVTDYADVGEEVSFEQVPEKFENQGYEWYGYTGIGKTTIEQEIDSEHVVENGDNIIKVYLAKPELTISKAQSKSEIKAGTEMEYTITITNTGWAKGTATVTDELKKSTYVTNSSTVGGTKKEPTIANNVLTWSNVEVKAANENTDSKKTEIKFKTTVSDTAFGEKVNNEAESNQTTNKKSNKVTADVDEIGISYNEMKEGKEGTELNIIFVIDNSSSMNQSVGGEFENNSDDDKLAVAPNDRVNTRMENAKKAINDFIQGQINAGTDNTMTVIKFNRNSTTNSAHIAKTEGEGYSISKWTRREYISTGFMSGYYRYYYNLTSNDGTETIEVYGTTEDFNGVEYDIYKATTGDDKYIKATDNKYYKFTTITNSKQGTQVIGTTMSGKSGALTNGGLKAAVSGMTIGDLNNSFATYVTPALEEVENYIDNTKTNVVIVLSDGAFNDSGNSVTQANKLINQKGVDWIYSVAFGSSADKDKLRAITNTTELENGQKKVYSASNSAELLEQFNAMAEAASKGEDGLSTDHGVIELPEATTDVKISDKCPIIGKYKTGEVDSHGDPIYETLFECTSRSDLSKYGLTVSGKDVTWDAKEFITKYKEAHPNVTNLELPSEIEIVYYIPNN